MADFKQQSYSQAPSAPKSATPSHFEGKDLRSWMRERERSHDEEMHRRILRSEEEAELKARIESVAKAASSLQSALAECQKDHQARLEEMVNQVVEMSLLVAQKIVDEELKTNPSLVLKLVQALVKETHTEKERKIRIHPEDQAFLQSAQKEACQLLEKEYGVIFEADASRPRGSCQLESRTHSIEASLHRRLEHLWKEALAREIPS